MTKQAKPPAGSASLEQAEIGAAAQKSDAVGSSAICCICREGDREDFMVLCDVCDHGYHLDCMDPKLNQLPEGDWMCQDCVNAGHVVIHEREWYV